MENLYITKIVALFKGPLFNINFKSKMHCIQLALVLVIISLTGARIATKPKSMPITRSDTLGIVMGIKTLFVLSYQMVTTHVAKYRRWRNLKVYQILNSLEVAFWLVVVIITFMGAARSCEGAYCGLTLLVAFSAITLTTFALWTAIVSHHLRRESRESERTKNVEELSVTVEK